MWRNGELRSEVLATFDLPSVRVVPWVSHFEAQSQLQKQDLGCAKLILRWPYGVGWALSIVWARKKRWKKMWPRTVKKHIFDDQTRFELEVVLCRCLCELSESEIRIWKSCFFQELFKKCSNVLRINLNLNLNLNSIWILILNSNLCEMKAWSKRFHLVKVSSKLNKTS